MMKLTAFVTAAAISNMAIFAVAGLPSEKQTSQTGKTKVKIEDLLIAAQQICPVSGQQLGSMGEPIKAKSGDRTIFLCCKGCLGRPIQRTAWTQIQKNLAEAQAICPVRKIRLPENPPSVVVKGRTVFVCCKACVKKVKADPEAALTVVNKQLLKHHKSLKSETK